MNTSKQPAVDPIDRQALADAPGSDMTLDKLIDHARIRRDAAAYLAAMITDMHQIAQSLELHGIARSLEAAYYSAIKASRKDPHAATTEP